VSVTFFFINITPKSSFCKINPFFKTPGYPLHINFFRFQKHYNHCLENRRVTKIYQAVVSGWTNSLASKRNTTLPRLVTHYIANSRNLAIQKQIFEDLAGSSKEDKSKEYLQFSIDPTEFKTDQNNVMVRLMVHKVEPVYLDCLPLRPFPRKWKEMFVGGDNTENLRLLTIELITGKTHQIRIQLKNNENKHSKYTQKMACSNTN